MIVAPAARRGHRWPPTTSKPASRSGTGGTPGGGYSSPVLATLAGRRQVLVFDAGGLAGFDIKAGEELWRHPWKTFQDMNIIQPIVLGGDRVFMWSK